MSAIRGVSSVRTKIPLLRDARSRRRHLRLVRPPATRHTVAFATLTVVVCLAAAFATVGLRALAAGDAVARARLADQVARAEARHTELIAEVARLENPARIEAVATRDLNMVPAVDAGFLVLDRALPLDAAPRRDTMATGERTDPLKPVLSVNR